MALSPVDRTRLACVLRLLGSDQPGERDAAGLAATRIVSCAGLDWDDLLQPVLPSRSEHPRQHQPTGEAAVRFDMRLCQRHLDKLSAWERDFIGSLSQRCKLTDGRVAKLKQIAADLRMRGCV
ncbi:MAG: hypothetical protein ACRYF2_12825 [Janthinobacterium lividum]